MNEVQLKELKEKLDNEIKTTQEKINTYSKLCKPISPQNSIGRISRMDAINNKSVVEAALRTSIEKMQQLKEMQKNISQSNFGICNKCNQAIPFGRLIIRPYSKFCVMCAE